jgi:excisionase family DNA binding protein
MASESEITRTYPRYLAQQLIKLYKIQFYITLTRYRRFWWCLVLDEEKRNPKRRGVVKEPHAGASGRPICDYKEAMELTGLKKTKIYDLFSRGVLRGYKDCTMIRFYRASLLAYMKERENTPFLPPPPRKARKQREGKAPNGMQFKFL